MLLAKVRGLWFLVCPCVLKLYFSCLLSLPLIFGLLAFALSFLLSPFSYFFLDLWTLMIYLTCGTFVLTSIQRESFVLYHESNVLCASPWSFLQLSLLGFEFWYLTFGIWPWHFSLGICPLAFILVPLLSLWY